MTHQAWLRGLVVELVGESDADDVVQQTYMAALSSPPRDRRAARGWLARVARNFVRRRHRAVVASEHRERRAARPESLPATYDIVADLAMQRHVSACVLALDEPYRSTLLWRFYEQLSIGEIAARSGDKSSTVRSRLQRGLEILRGRLHRDYGSDWRVLVAVPLLRPTAVLQPSVAITFLSIGAKALLMTKPGKLAVGLCVLIATCWAILPWMANEPSTPALQTTVGEPSIAGRVSEMGRGKVFHGVPDRHLIVDSVAQPNPSSTVEPVAGFVVDDSGRPVADIEVALLPMDGSGVPFLSAAVSDADGRFTLPSRPGEFELRPAPSHAALRSARLPLRGDRSVALLVVAPAVRLHGRVADQFGLALPGVRIDVGSFDLPDFPLSLESTALVRYPTVETDTEGRFELSAIPRSTLVDLRFAKHGYRIRHVPGRTYSDAAMYVELMRAEQDALTLQVLDHRNRLVEGAEVHFGSGVGRTDSRGECSVAWPTKAGRLTVVKHGLQPWRVDRYERSKWQRSGSPLPLLVRLGGAALEIRGRVLDPEGEPCSDWAVTLLDSSATSPGKAAESVAASGAPTPQDMLFGTTSDDGSFVVGGLANRAYRVRVYDRESLVCVTSPPITAGGPGVELRVPANALRERLVGTLVDSRNRPLSAISVAFQQVLTMIGGQGKLDGNAFDQTDAEGRFELRDVPRQPAYLFVMGPNVPPREIDISDRADEDDLRIVIPMSCRAQLLPPIVASEAEAVGFVDAEGRSIDMTIESRDTVRTVSRWQLKRGKSPVLQIPDTAVALRYFKNAELVREQAVALVPGQMNSIQL